MDIQRIGIIGAGVMGAQIAQVVASGGHTVHLYDINDGQLETALQRIEHGRFGLRGGVARGKLTEQEYFAWLKDHADEASFALDDMEFCALFDVEPEDLRAWRTADVE